MKFVNEERRNTVTVTAAIDTITTTTADTLRNIIAHTLTHTHTRAVIAISFWHFRVFALTIKLIRHGNQLAA